MNAQIDDYLVNIEFQLQHRETDQYEYIPLFRQPTCGSPAKYLSFGSIINIFNDIFLELSSRYLSLE
jgi:hypothetical protein